MSWSAWIRIQYNHINKSPLYLRPFSGRLCVLACLKLVSNLPKWDFEECQQMKTTLLFSSSFWNGKEAWSVPVPRTPYYKRRSKRFHHHLGVQALKRKHLTLHNLPHSIQVLLNLLVPPQAKRAAVILLPPSILQNQGRTRRTSPLRPQKVSCEFINVTWFSTFVRILKHDPL